jgi:hypothetical protein
VKSETNVSVKITQIPFMLEAHVLQVIFWHKTTNADAIFKGLFLSARGGNELFFAHGSDHPLQVVLKGDSYKEEIVHGGETRRTGRIGKCLDAFAANHFWDSGSDVLWSIVPMKEPLLEDMMG